MPFNLGVLFVNAGEADRVRYADLGLFTGDPLPIPEACPRLGIPICGGACGGCPGEDLCTGRSPLHPYGICVPPVSGQCSPMSNCGTGKACFTYLVEPAAQAIADDWGYCLPTDLCEAIASQLPGGGACS
jgi:hypothetical protein